jgi:WD40 repeat protein
MQIKRAFPLIALMLCIAAQDVQQWQAIAYQRGNSAALSLVYSPDGQTIAADFADGSTLVTDVTPDFLTAAAFSPTGGLAYAQEAELTLPDRETPVSLDVPIRALLFNADGSILAVALDDGSLRILSSSNGEEQARLEGFDGVAAGLRFSPDGEVLAAGNPQLNQVRLWNPSNPTEQVVLPGQYPYAFSADGRLFAIKSNDQQISIRVVDEILEREEDEILIQISGHLAPISDMTFLPDGDHLLTASQDGSLSLWNIRSGAEVTIFSGHLAAVTSVAVSPNGAHFASADAHGQVMIWDIASGAMLQELDGAGAAITKIAFNADGSELAGTDRDGGLIRWGVGDAADLPTSSTAASDSSVDVARLFENGVIGAARQDLVGGAHPMSPVGCFIAEDEKVLALARSPEGAFLVMAGGESCEGRVWVNVRSRVFDWQDLAALAELPIVEPEGNVVPRARLVETDSICSAAGRTVTASASRALRLYPPDGLPAAVQATVTEGIDAIICHEYSTTPIENCHRLDANLFSHIFTRQRTDDVITVVDFNSGDVLARRRFEGQPPDLCPNRVARGEAVGEPAPPSEWVPWLLGETENSALAPLRTTLVGGRTAHMQPDDSSDVLVTFDSATPVHPLGRSGNDWVLALLPDMSMGWVPAADVRPAAQVSIAQLPDTADVAARPAFVAERTDQLAQFTDFRPLGRFQIPAEYSVTSHDGFYIASVDILYVEVADAQEPIEIPTLSMWDIRGGVELWSISLPDREVEEVIFSPHDNRLLVKTTANLVGVLGGASSGGATTLSDEEIDALLADLQNLSDEEFEMLLEALDNLANDETPANLEVSSDPIEEIPEEIRFSFFDTLTGEIIGETGDVDIIEMPTIPGNMPQFLNARPYFTQDESKVIVNYWRRAEASRCAVWDVATAEIVWQMEATCGMVNGTGEFLALFEPYDEIFSAYDHLVIYETDSGTPVLESPYEATNANWLNDETLIIYRPYGDPPIMWNIVGNSVAVVELPGPLPNLQFDALNRVMFHATGQETFAWDIATGEFLGSTTLQGQIIDLPTGVIVLQQVEEQEDDRWVQYLRAVSLENEEVLWQRRWGFRDLTLRDDGLYGFSYNWETGVVEILDMGTGESVGTLRAPDGSFTLTEDWNWIVFGGGSSLMVWGLEENVELFDDTPHVRTDVAVPVYYEANTNFPADIEIPADRYLWLRQRTPDGAWVMLDGYGQNFWIPSESLEALRDLESVAVYEPL